MPLMLSLLSRPKLITLSGFYFTIQLFSIQNQKFSFVRSFISLQFVLWCCTRCSCCCCCCCWLCFIELITRWSSWKILLSYWPLTTRGFKLKSIRGPHFKEKRPRGPHLELKWAWEPFFKYCSMKFCVSTGRTNTLTGPNPSNVFETPAIDNQRLDIKKIFK